MSDLICRFESLRSDKTLLDAQRLELERLTDYYGDEDARVLKLRGSIKDLEAKLAEALTYLDLMVERAPSAKEACRLSDERLFLTYRYMQDMTMEQTAEAMHVSRDTVYRIRRRIIGRSHASETTFSRETSISRETSFSRETTFSRETSFADCGVIARSRSGGAVPQARI